MLDTEKEKRQRAEKTAYAINSIEGVPVSEETKRLSVWRFTATYR